MNKRGQERIEKTECCHSHTHAVHDQRAHKILHDDPSAASRDPQSFDQLREIASNQNHVRTFSGHIRSRSHGDADIGLDQRWSVVDSITDHGNISPFAAQPGHPLRFLFRQQSSHCFVHAKIVTHR